MYAYGCKFINADQNCLTDLWKSIKNSRWIKANYIKNTWLLTIVFVSATTFGLDDCGFDVWDFWKNKNKQSHMRMKGIHISV